MRSAYVRTKDCPISWESPVAVTVTRLLAELVDHLQDDSIRGVPRARAEAVLFDLLQPVAVATIDVRMPGDDRALAVARSLQEGPADGRTLVEWGREVGASGRTLARLFLGETGLPFGRWRSLVRLQAALTLLAQGKPVSRVASDVGYNSTSAFVAAFKREFGFTPGAYYAP
jgi:AraC-like DNA-binding protein